MGLERRTEPIVSCRIELAATLARAVNGVAEGLSSFVGELARTKGFQPCLAVVERILRRFAGAIQLLFQSIE
jgi:hypothetical protein